MLKGIFSVVRIFQTAHTHFNYLNNFITHIKVTIIMMKLISIVAAANDNDDDN